MADSTPESNKNSKGKKIKYTDEPMEVGRVIPDFLPPPGEIVLRKIEDDDE